MPVDDRGFQYGDGLFETIAVFDGRPCLWTAHIARLARGAERLGIPLPDTAQLADEARTLSQGVERGVLKLMLTRGAGGRGYGPPKTPRARRVLSLHPWPDYPAAWARHGVQVRWCDTPLGLNPVLAGLKHCNRLEQVLARAEWGDPAIAEGLMCDTNGQVVEGTMTNLFVLSGGTLHTPSLTSCGVAGIARAEVLAAADQLGIAWEETAVSRADVANADAVLLSNSLIGLWPVAQLAEREWSPDAWPRALIDRVMERVRRP